MKCVYTEPTGTCNCYKEKPASWPPSFLFLSLTKQICFLSTPTRSHSQTPLTHPQNPLPYSSPVYSPRCDSLFSLLL